MRFEEIADGAVCVATPERMYAVGQWYQDFTQTTDVEVEALLAEARRAGKGRATGETTVEKVRRHAMPFLGEASDYLRIADEIEGSRFVLIGEATHGTHDFYRVRAEITKHLIEERGFNAVAVEADWPDADRVNRFVRDLGEDREAIESLESFQRFPIWMWRNADVLDFIGWLREHNDDATDERRKVGFYGLDLYSLHRSAEAVLHYLDRVDREAAKRAKARYECFEAFPENGTSYGEAASFGLVDSCEDEVVRALVELQSRSNEYRSRDGRFHPDDQFYAEQNARLVRNAEQYYRVMYRGHNAAWNLRDQHMLETLEAIDAHLRDRLSEHPKIVVWAHNSHLGDARATELGRRGEWNLGQLVRERHPDAALFGFSMYQGTVTAAREWGDAPQRMKVRPALETSWEYLFHETGIPRFFVSMRNQELAEVLRPDRLQRAIGVIYRPETERMSHYFGASLANQFDLVLHFDETRAVEPLDRIGAWAEDQMPETYPSGL
jgi:erythromycin esterase-like protein